MKNNKTPKVSIITVCYNSQDTIERSIDSVFSQNYDNIEYIVVDGNSKDNTKDILKRKKDKITKLISESDNGMYDALNKGIENTTGDIIGILNSDDIFSDKDVISRIIREFKKNKVDSVYGDIVYFDDGDKIKRHYKSPKDPKKGFKKAIQPAHPTFFVKREIYEKHGKYNTKYKIGGDYDLLLRFLYKHNISYKYIPEVLVKMKHRGVSNNSTKNILTNNLEVYKASRENGLKITPATIILKLLYKYLSFLSTKLSSKKFQRKMMVIL